MEKEDKIGFEFYSENVIDYAPAVKIQNNPSKEEKTKEKKERVQMNISFREKSKYLMFRRYCKTRNINMSSLVRRWINECIDKALNE